MSRLEKHLLVVAMGAGLLLGVGAWWCRGADFGMSALGGALLGVVNLWLLMRAVRALVDQGEGLGRRAITLRFMVKYAVLVTGLAVALLMFKADAVALALGLSNVPVAAASLLFIRADVAENEER